jgi:hypothetical protein
VDDQEGKEGWAAASEEDKYGSLCECDKTWQYAGVYVVLQLYGQKAGYKKYECTASEAEIAFHKKSRGRGGKV